MRALLKATVTVACTALAGCIDDPYYTGTVPDGYQRPPYQQYSQQPRPSQQTGYSERTNYYSQRSPDTAPSQPQRRQMTEAEKARYTAAGMAIMLGGGPFAHGNSDDEEQRRRDADYEEAKGVIYEQNQRGER